MPPEGSGIHPTEASIHHAAIASKVISEAIETSGVGWKDIDAVAYAMGPGLGPCLRVGAVTARTVSLSLGRPLVPVNHAVGHIELGCMLTGAKSPLVLLISGGHTMVVSYSSGMWRVLGETLDLTLGQLLDQLGRHVGYASPCGRRIEEAASRSHRYLRLPYTVKGNDVSFSGILTAAKRLIDAGEPFDDVCFSVQETAFATAVEVTERALAFTGNGELMVVGGVAANKRLAEMLGVMVGRHSAKFHVVPAALQRGLRRPDRLDRPPGLQGGRSRSPWRRASSASPGASTPCPSRGGPAREAHLPRRGGGHLSPGSGQARRPSSSSGSRCPTGCRSWTQR